MRLLLAAFILAASATFAEAGCSNYLDGSMGDSPVPKVTICFKGKCEETTQDYSCGNANSAQYGYHNGWIVNTNRDGTVDVYRRVPVKRSDFKSITCKSDSDGCFVPLK